MKAESNIKVQTHKTNVLRWDEGHLNTLSLKICVTSRRQKKPIAGVLFSPVHLLQEQSIPSPACSESPPSPYNRGSSLWQLLPQSLQSGQRLLQADQQRVPKHLQIWIELKRRTPSSWWSFHALFLDLPLLECEQFELVLLANQNICSGFVSRDGQAVWFELIWNL